MKKSAAIRAVKPFSRRSLNRKDTRKRRGAAIVEVAVCFPVFLLIILGILEFGRAFMVSQLLSNAAREGCRSAALVGSTNDVVEPEIRNMVTQLVGCDPADVNLTITVTDNHTGIADSSATALDNADQRDLVDIDITVAYSDISYGVGKFLTGKNMQGRCIMRHE